MPTNRNAFSKLRDSLVLPENQMSLVTWQEALDWLTQKLLTQAADQVRVNPLL